MPFILILLLLAYAVPGFFDFRSLIEPQRDEYGTPVSVNSPKIISESFTSPDNAYIIEVGQWSSTEIRFDLYDKDGRLLERRWLDGITYTDKKEIDGDGDVQGCDCQVSFKGWINNHTFVIRTIKEDGIEYEDIIDIKKLL